MFWKSDSYVCVVCARVGTWEINSHECSIASNVALLESVTTFGENFVVGIPRLGLFDFNGRFK